MGDQVEKQLKGIRADVTGLSYLLLFVVVVLVSVTSTTCHKTNARIDSLHAVVDTTEVP